MPEPLRTLLADYHASRGVALTTYHGALAPARFSDLIAEHRAARETAGIFDFSFRVKMCVAGQDRAAFLHNMLSNDIKRLAPGQGTYATLLDLKGHIVADLRVYCASDLFLLDTDADLVEKLVQTLERYIIMDDVAVERLSLGTLSVQGTRARELAETVFATRLPPLEEFGHASIDHAGAQARVVRSSSTGEEGYELWVEARGLVPLWESMCRAGQALAALPCGCEALETLRIEAGIPRYGADFGEDTLPLEAGLLDALSFTKGCYLGQEIVERARSRGHVNWKLAGLVVESDGAPAPGEKLVAGDKEVGEITSSCLSPTLGKVIALGYLRREAAEPGTELALASGAAAQVTSLPFYSSAEARNSKPENRT
ncbi:MAG TPA: aminomethyltransferase family protein [Terriglobia bacterium]|nr:aminomethyltransferase family protein [Terriglobia bacterium]